MLFLFNSDGKLDIVIPSFVHYLEVLDGSDGDKMPGIKIMGTILIMIRACVASSIYII